MILKQIAHVDILVSGLLFIQPRFHSSSVHLKHNSHYVLCQKSCLTANIYHFLSDQVHICLAELHYGDIV